MLSDVLDFEVITEPEEESAIELNDCTYNFYGDWHVSEETEE